MSDERFALAVDHPHVDAVAARWQTPARDDRGVAYLLAHGAGAPFDSDLLEAVTDGLLARGVAVLRFLYPYMERARREGRRLPPDRAPRLEAAHARALEALEERAGDRCLLLGGRSMGGRMASHLAARGARCDGLVFLGYPLHPARDPDRERSEHFPALATPALFVQGTRDALCQLPRLGRALEVYGGEARLHLVEGADHGFRLPRRAGRTPAEVIDELVTAVDGWLAADLGL